MSKKPRLTRRTALKTVAAVGGVALIEGAGSDAVLMASEPPRQPTDLRKKVFEKVWSTPLIDTHEHLPDEQDRLAPRRGKGDDWSVVFSHYLSNDLVSAGMPRQARNKFYAPGLSPAKKWKLLEPYWPAVKNTGYGQAARIAVRELYGVEDVSAATVEKIQAGYEKTRRPGFYRRILCELGNIESCQVDYMRTPFWKSKTPAFLMQDIDVDDMVASVKLAMHSKPAGVKVAELSDWHKVIDWWFDKYGRYAVAIKSRGAYHRDIDYWQTPAKQVEGTFKKRVDGQRLDHKERKALEDHLFWCVVQKAAEHDLPVKMHTGYYVGQNWMPLSRLRHNAGSACDLCRLAPKNRFVFFHIGYPYYEEMIALAKHWTNAYLDMCWAWIINPVAAKDFLKKYLVTAPANKVFTFGGDYYPVELVLGHAVLARQGIALALSELVEEGWMDLDDALELVDPIMHGNAREFYGLSEKEKVLRAAPWAKSSHRPLPGQ
jgi:predicted TIM-barrel fold metal-dependent hydrolase